MHGPQPEHQVRTLLHDLSAAGRADVHYLRADYGDLASVVELADGISSITRRVDVLVNNAGRPGAENREVTRRGYEATLQTDYLAAVLLTEHLTLL